ncbi:MAG: lipase maturation factor family protein, partial [Acidobacteria bacterium]|nr:lipase maturation factor family protein [Acidobacteriota bacterium]
MPSSPMALPNSGARRWFFRLLALSYLCAFWSLYPQITGLIGSHGILPAGDFVHAVRSAMGPERYWAFPTLAWISASDTFLRLLCLGGALLSLVVMAGFLTAPILVVLWVLYLSLVVAGQEFLSFQWDALLLETGFLAVLFAMESRAVWLLRFLLFRLMFSSGAVKLASGDPAWRSLTALNYHYETQPLPNPIAWYV